MTREFRTHRKVAMFRFDPKLDITAYELAIISQAYPNFAPHNVDYLRRNIPKSMRRHFEHFHTYRPEILLIRDD